MSHDGLVENYIKSTAALDFKDIFAVSDLLAYLLDGIHLRIRAK